MGLLRRCLALGACAAALLATAPTVAAAEPAPFGHACTPQNGVRFCPTTDLAGRVPSFDGTPLDVDVTLPPTGEGPWPTVLLLHGLGQTKTSFEAAETGPSAYTNTAFAARGYAVITPTARGFGNSCGTLASRTAGCEQGWLRLDDMRYEIRDLQTLAGLLVDQKIARPDAIGATGVSYGGGASTMLAYLKNRVRNVDGSYSPWTSPAGTPISLAAAWPRWPWTNGESIFTRNGRGAWSRSPVGVTAQSYANGIFAVGGVGFVAPAGGDVSADITRWKAQIDAGAVDAGAQAILDNAYNYHGIVTVKGAPSPLLFQTGWTDALFPATQVRAAAEALLKADKNAPVAVQVGNLGHGPASNPPADLAAFTAQGNAFMDAWLLGAASGKLPAGQVTARTTVCPKDAPAGGGPYVATGFDGLARGSVRLSARSLRITQKGGSAKLAASLAPVGGDAICTAYAPDRSTKATTLIATSKGATLLGMPVITGKVKAKGKLGQIDARVWDRNPKTGKQLLVTRGAYRLKTDQSGTMKFTLDGNGYRFAPGHRIVVELLGTDAPTYGPSPGAFSARLTDVRVTLPVRERPSASKNIRKP